LPDREEFFYVQAQEPGELSTIAHFLIYTRIADHLIILNSLNLASMLRTSPDEIIKLRDNLPPWVLIFSLAGYGVLPRDMFEYKLKGIENADFDFSSNLPEISSEEIWGILRRPSEEPFWKLRFKGDSRDLFFQTSLIKIQDYYNLIIMLINLTRKDRGCLNSQIMDRVTDSD
jgi:hypothetical protein